MKMQVIQNNEFDRDIANVIFARFAIEGVASRHTIAGGKWSDVADRDEMVVTAFRPPYQAVGGGSAIAIPGDEQAAICVFCSEVYEAWDRFRAKIVPDIVNAG